MAKISSNFIPLLPKYVQGIKESAKSTNDKNSISSELIENLDPNLFNICMALLEKVREEFKSFNTWTNYPDYSKEFRLNELFSNLGSNFALKQVELLKGFFRFKGTANDVQYIMNSAGFGIQIRDSNYFLEQDILSILERDEWRLKYSEFKEYLIENNLFEEVEKYLQSLREEIQSLRTPDPRGVLNVVSISPDPHEFFKKYGYEPNEVELSNFQSLMDEWTRSWDTSFDEYNCYLGLDISIDMDSAYFDGVQSINKVKKLLESIIVTRLSICDKLKYITVEFTLTDFYTRIDKLIELFNLAINLRTYDKYLSVNRITEFWSHLETKVFQDFVWGQFCPEKDYEFEVLVDENGNHTVNVSDNEGYRVFTSLENLTTHEIEVVIEDLERSYLYAAMKATINNIHPFSLSNDQISPQGMEGETPKDPPFYWREDIRAFDFEDDSNPNAYPNVIYSRTYLENRFRKPRKIGSRFFPKLKVPNYYTKKSYSFFNFEKFENHNDYTEFGPLAPFHRHGLTITDFDLIKQVTGVSDPVYIGELSLLEIDARTSYFKNDDKIYHIITLDDTFKCLDENGEFFRFPGEKEDAKYDWYFSPYLTIGTTGSILDSAKVEDLSKLIKVLGTYYKSHIFFRLQGKALWVNDTFSIINSLRLGSDEYPFERLEDSALKINYTIRSKEDLKLDLKEVHKLLPQIAQVEYLTTSRTNEIYVDNVLPHYAAGMNREVRVLKNAYRIPGRFRICGEFTFYIKSIQESKAIYNPQELTNYSEKQLEVFNPLILSDGNLELTIREATTDTGILIHLEPSNDGKYYYLGNIEDKYFEDISIEIGGSSRFNSFETWTLKLRELREDPEFQHPNGLSLYSYNTIDRASDEYVIYSEDSPAGEVITYNNSFLDGNQDSVDIIFVNDSATLASETLAPVKSLSLAEKGLILHFSDDRTEIPAYKVWNSPSMIIPGDLPTYDSSEEDPCDAKFDSVSYGEHYKSYTVPYPIIGLSREDFKFVSDNDLGAFAEIKFPVDNTSKSSSIELINAKSFNIDMLESPDDLTSESLYIPNIKKLVLTSMNDTIYEGGCRKISDEELKFIGPNSRNSEVFRISDLIEDTVFGNHLDFLENIDPKIQTFYNRGIDDIFTLNDSFNYRLIIKSEEDRWRTV